MDGFFGFDTTLPEDDGRGHHRLEEEYDALNDETFGAATKEDWEDLHEDLVRRSGHNTIVSTKNDDSEDYDSDLDINFHRLKLDDCDLANDDFDSRTQLDPSVWKCSEKSLLNSKPSLVQNNNNLSKVQIPTPTRQILSQDLLRLGYGHGIHQQLHMQQQQQQQQKFGTPPQMSQNQQPQSQASLAQQTSLLKQLIGAPQSQAPPTKIMSLEEIERNLINQQQQQQQHKMIQEKLAALAKMPNPQNSSQIQQTPPQQMRKLQQPQNQQGHQQNQQQAPNQLHNQQIPGRQQQVFPPHPLLNPVQTRLPPPGFSPPSNMQGPNMGPKFNPMMQIPNHPMNMNNFVHPTFGGPLQRPLQPQQMSQNQQQMQRMPPHLMQQMQQQMGQQPPQNQQQQMQQNQLPQNSAQFNQRLVQEIQQNHPMLSYRNQQQQQQQQQQRHHMNGNQNHQQRYNMKLDEYDEYANLMTTREKQFLITIQMMQLNTETPYFDDYYYTVFKERQKEKGLNNESSTHKDNQMNHPFTQPKDHATMLLRQFSNLQNMNKNGMNQKNGMNRERKNSESSTKNDQNKDQPTPRTYTPLQFENSLGKLQCGSVTAPRKIIDMEIIDNSESGGSGNQIVEPTTQRKSRQLLLHIETLYRIVLKLEDLQNPMAISAAVILKEKREKEKQQQLENEKENEFNVNTGGGSSVLCTPSKASISLNEPEGMDVLMPKLLGMLPLDKIAGMMTVRKGRVLLKRILPHIKEHPVRWDIWCTVFTSLTLMKRDKLDEIEDTLMPFYFEFANHLQGAEFKEVLKITDIFLASPKLVGYVNGCKFIVSSVIALIIQSELLFHKSCDFINQNDQEKWVIFLNKLCETSKSTENLNQLSLAYSLHREHNNEKIIKTVAAHFKRFPTQISTDPEKLIKILSLQYDVK